MTDPCRCQHFFATDEHINVFADSFEHQRDRETNSRTVSRQPSRAVFRQRYLAYDAERRPAFRTCPSSVLRVIL
jgi:hypothetical protein